MLKSILKGNFDTKEAVLNFSLKKAFKFNNKSSLYENKNLLSKIDVVTVTIISFISDWLKTASVSIGIYVTNKN